MISKGGNSGKCTSQKTVSYFLLFPSHGIYYQFPSFSSLESQEVVPNGNGIMSMHRILYINMMRDIFHGINVRKKIHFKYMFPNLTTQR